MNAPATGSLTAQDQAVTLQLRQAASSATIQVYGTFSGTVSFTASNDGINYYTIKAVDGTTSSMTSAGIAQFAVGGFAFLKATCTSYASGTAKVYILDSIGAV